MKKYLPPAIKLLGFVIFAAILWRIDRLQLALHIAQADKKLLLGALFIIYAMYICKAARWHILVKAAGVHMHPVDSWRLFMIGVFLAIITPSRIGELGKAAYLRKHEMHMKTGISLVVIERLIDIVLIACIAVWGAGVLFGTTWVVVGLLCLTGCAIALVLLKQHIRALQKIDWLRFTQLITKPRTALAITSWTLLGWALYFTWTILIARAIDVELSIPVLIATLTIVGIVAILPIAPSGLGTREAAMITLLSPLGIGASQAVAFSMLIFAVIVSTGMLGGWYWLRGNRPAIMSAESPYW